MSVTIEELMKEKDGMERAQAWLVREIQAVREAERQARRDMEYLQERFDFCVRRLGQRDFELHMAEKELKAELRRNEVLRGMIEAPRVSDTVPTEDKKVIHSLLRAAQDARDWLKHVAAESDGLFAGKATLRGLEAAIAQAEGK